MRLFNSIISIVCVMGIMTSGFSQPAKTMETYLNALRNSDWDTAEQCWTPEAVLASKHLGIVFTDFLPKYDNASPLITYHDAISSGQATVKTGEIITYENYCMIPVTVVIGKDSTSTSYLMEQIDERWLISSPLFLFTRDWQTIETTYAIIHFNDSTLINDYALKNLDEWTLKIGRELRIPKDKMIQLQRQKIHYYLGSEEDVKLLTGFNTYGMTNLQFDAIISQYLPHPHEMVHLLINFGLEEKPLYTMPFLQEGLASYVGGRWGKSPEVIRMMGSYLLRNSVVELDSVLTWSGFNYSIGMSDLTYPVSAEFVGFLIRNRGWNNFQDVYLDFSDLPVNLMGRSAQTIHQDLIKTKNNRWADITESFQIAMTNDSLSGIIPGKEIKPGMGISPKILQEFTKEGVSVKISGSLPSEFPNHSDSILTSDRYSAIIEAIIPDDLTTVTLFYTDSNLVSSDRYMSRLFREQFPNMDYSKECFALRFSNREAGIYNYLTNCLEAKYVVDFNPSNDYWDAKQRKVTFSVTESMMPVEIWKLYFEKNSSMEVKLVVQREN